MLIKMCPISALSQFLLTLICIFLICVQRIKAEKPNLSIKATADETIMLDTTYYVNYTINGTVPSDYGELYLQISTRDASIAKPENTTIPLKNEVKSNWLTTGLFGVKGAFLGKTSVVLTVRDAQSDLAETSVNIKVVRPIRVVDTVFTATVATLVTIIYINFGCALNWEEVRATVKKPIGPAIGFFGQFIVMPLLSFGLAKALFPDNAEMQLGMFFTGVSPGGGASNVWVAVLNGDINLSITMTTISTFAAFGMMPLWLFTLGKIIFEQAEITVPYRQISTYAIALVVPLAIGYVLQRFCKRIARFFTRILKVFSSILILFIVIFAIVTNLYLFEIFSWEIIIAGMGLPWLGYVIAYILAVLFKQPPHIALTIAVETGIQNTGIAIFLLRFALPQPEADIVTVVPVYIATMTPLPLFVIFIYQKIRGRMSANAEKMSLLNSRIHLSDCTANSTDTSTKSSVPTIA
ncbi:hypothetical protein RN001_012562 [Aquatica leii]|uniref:Ileal sodium/bile acid cotransporter n=1 Tax=Aquatica leii TaxID=1421715 RepID=A0AAN7Q1R2_9COLE|nr:hypothetical protein RN001_012562 [Aquatica leii]